MKKNNLLRMILSALFLAVAYVLPFFTGQIPEIGSMLCPMHLPVLLCGFICGWYWGLAVGFIAPLFRSLILGMPVMFPMGICMAFELAAYGAVSGLMHEKLPHKKPFIYISLFVSMLTGRVIWGLMMFLCTGLSGGAFTLSAFFSGAFINAVPGIILQVIIVPLLVMIIDNPKVIKRENLK